VVLGVIMQLGVAAVLLAGIATFTGIIDWPVILRSVIPGGVLTTADAPPVAARPAGKDGKPLLDRAFEALPAPNPADGRQPSCNVADSARLSRLSRAHRDWDQQVRDLISCRQVRPGFSVEQLRAAVGKPAKIVQHESGGEEWIYNQLRVVVKDGQVTAVER
jgi:hypothetical protein